MIVRQFREENGEDSDGTNNSKRKELVSKEMDSALTCLNIADKKRLYNEETFIQWGN